MLELTEVQALLGAVVEDDAPRSRLAGLEALTHLPLSDEAWRAIGPHVNRMLAGAEPGTADRRAAIELAVRVPLASVREELRGIAAASDDPDAATARELLGERSQADVDALLQRVAADPPDAFAAEALATMAIERFDVDVRSLRKAALGPDPHAGVWAAVALARTGDVEPLDRILADEEGEHGSFPGNPWSAYDRLAAARPIPAPLHAHLMDWLGDHPERRRDPNLIAWALTGAFDAEGSPIEDPPAAGRTDEDVPPPPTAVEDGLDVRVLRNLFGEERLEPYQVAPEVWRRLTPEQAGRVVAASVRRIAGAVDHWHEDERMWQAIDAGNRLVTVASMVPSEIDLPVGELYGLHRHKLRGVIDDGQMACVLAKGDGKKTVQFFARSVPALEPFERVKAFDMLRRIGDFHQGQAGPILGAGPSSGSSPPVRDLIDDLPRYRALPPTDPTLESMPGDDVEMPPPADEPSAGATPPPPASAPAWPHLQAPAAVVAGEVFPIEVGLGKGRDATLHGTGALAVPSADYTLAVELLIDGFAVVGDRTFTLEVTAGDRFPKRSVQLLALAGAGLAERREIGVVYRIGNEMRGYAGREIHVKATAGDAAAVAPPRRQPTPGGIDTAAFASAGAADLTLVIQRGAAADESRLLWSVVSPHLDLDVPAEAPVSELGTSPEQFLAELVDEASTTPDTLNLYASLVGRGKSQIARRMPKPVRDALHDVAATVAPRAPTVLLVSQDPYVPWELAVLDPPLPGTPAGGSPFLGAQAAISRWVLQSEPPPPIDPPRHLDVRSTALVTGVYEEVPDWNRLESAEREVDELEKRWPSPQRVEATLPAVLKCINGEPAADIIHFALHGQFSMEGARQGLVLIGTVRGHPDQKEPEFLKPSHVASGGLARHPLVFLNACQVGANRMVLGNYSGMAGDFVGIGASGVVAPLWSVNDEVASDFAIEFYEATLDRGETPAEALRAARAKVTKAAVDAGAPEASGTRLAYQFFGHPNMRLAR